MAKRQWLIWGGVLIVVIGVTILGYIAWLTFQPGPYDFAGGHRVDLANYQGPSPAGVPPELRAAGLLVRGEYITRMADCEACHTQEGGIPFAGGRSFKLPFGTIYTPNITPDRNTGIGRWSDAEFLRAVHEGIGEQGERLYPAFPYASYTLLTDPDVLAVKAYLFSLKPVKLANKPNTFFSHLISVGLWPFGHCCSTLTDVFSRSQSEVRYGTVALIWSKQRGTAVNATHPGISFRLWTSAINSLAGRLKVGPRTIFLLICRAE